MLDFKLYVPGHPLVPNTLWVMEQIPGLVVGADETSLLTFGYFPSYNVPFFERIYNASGYPEMVTKMGDIPGLGYQNAPRAQIFRRDQGTVTNISSFQHMMRYNNYEQDPISQGDPFGAVCSRGDLSKDGAQPFGWSVILPLNTHVIHSGHRCASAHQSLLFYLVCVIYSCLCDLLLFSIDTKVTSFSLYQQGLAYIVNGPTTNGGTLPPFSWSAFPDVPHSSLPEIFDFGFIPTQW